MTDTRSLVLDILEEYERSGVFLSDIVRAVQDKYDYIGERDKAFIKSLATGTVEKQIALDAVIDGVSDIKVKKMKPVIRRIIRMAACEMIYMDHIPARASVNEAVRLTKKKHIGGLSGFVNAVTRKIALLCEAGQISFENDRIRYSFPEFVFDLLKDGYGEETALKIMEASGKCQRLYLRVNGSRCGRDELMDILKKEGIQAEKPQMGDHGILVKDYIPLRSEAFLNGLCSVQDLSSQLCIEAAGITGDEDIIDLCAAPGGKACFASELLKGRGSVRAFDISDDKVQKINENIKRLGLNNITALVKDAEIYDEGLKESADIVIADLPCSGLGVMGRKVDIKYRVTREGIISLAALQRRILDNACRYLKSGGKLVFSTCTLTHEETDMQADHIESAKGLKKLFEKRFIQGVEPCDGFYYSVFIKA